MLLGLLAIACDDSLNITTITAVNPGEPVLVKVNLKAGGFDCLPGYSRAVIDEDSPKIKNVWLLQFNGTGDDAKLVKASYIPDMDKAQAELLASDAENDVLVIANTFDPLLYKDKDKADYSMLYIKRNFPRTAKDDDIYWMLSKDDAGEWYPVLNGLYTGPVTGNTTISVAGGLKRNVARIDISFNMPDNLVIENASAGNVPKQSFFYNSYLTEGEIYPTPQDIMNMGTSSLDVSAIKTIEGKKVSYKFYLPANMRGVSAKNTMQSKKNTFAIINSTYIELNCKNTEDNSVRTYKFYLGANFVNDFNIKPNFAYNYTVNISATPSENDSRVQDFGSVDYTYKEFSNCYILNPAPSGDRKFKIPVGRVDQFWGGYSKEEIYENEAEYQLGADGSNPRNWYVKILWADVDTVTADGKDILSFAKRTGSGRNDYFEVAVPPSAKGNVVVAIYMRDQDGNLQANNNLNKDILWSWHLWITDYNPDYIYNEGIAEDIYCYGVPGDGEVHRYNGTNWASGKLYDHALVMDRNVGAFSTDYFEPGSSPGILFFEFGRKDPFLFPTSTYLPKLPFKHTVPTRSNDDTNVKYSVLNPTMFFNTEDSWTENPKYSGNGEWGDYYSTSENNRKSIFDPSPCGWQLPQKFMWDKVPTLSPGIEHFQSYTLPNSTSVAKYPRLGLVFRSLSRAWPTSVIYATSNPAGIFKAYRWYGTYCDTYSRSSAAPVRCVKIRR